MTRERAEYIRTHLAYGDIRYAFPRRYAYNGGRVHADGLTPEEDADVRRVWDTMPGHTCYYDALTRIARGEATP